mmetsp:Transcript_29335/g.53053  ORF Transcript_29335/g.53053 Transcript_29335/m.53053 type:complete len:210 (-) Transcript_29335:1520-2149(-)
MYAPSTKGAWHCNGATNRPQGRSEISIGLSPVLSFVVSTPEISIRPSVTASASIKRILYQRRILKNGKLAFSTVGSDILPFARTVKIVPAYTCKSQSCVSFVESSDSLRSIERLRLEGNIFLIVVSPRGKGYGVMRIASSVSVIAAPRICKSKEASKDSNTTLFNLFSSSDEGASLSPCGQVSSLSISAFGVTSGNALRQASPSHRQMA